MITLNETALRLLLLGIVVAPLVGALAALPPAPPGLRGSSPDQAVLRHGVTVTGAVFLGTLLLAAAFDHDDPAATQARTDLSWIPALDVRLHFGVDGISLPLLVLTALLTFLCALYSYYQRPPGARGLVALLLVLETGTLATFTALDLMVFFLAFETVLIPMYFLIARWGGAERASASWKFILYTLLGSVVMLLGFLLIGLSAGTFDMVALADAHGENLTRSTQLLAVLAIGIGFAVKTPMWPLHSWLPSAHTAAPTVGSVLLAGVLLKVGSYGLVRIALPIAPEGAQHFAPYLAVFATVGIIYGSLVCLALVREGSGGDLKLLIAYSSIGHMGFVLLGIATLTPTGVNGALFANVAHGLITSLLFFLAGAVRDRSDTMRIDDLAGKSGAALYGSAPCFGGLFAFAAIASLGLPGLAGFWGELLAMLGAFQPADGLSRPLYLVCLAFAAFGTLLTAGYLLQLVRRICMGPNPAERQHVDHAPGDEPDLPEAQPQTNGREQRRSTQPSTGALGADRAAPAPTTADSTEAVGPAAGSPGAAGSAGRAASAGTATAGHAAAAGTAAATATANRAPGEPRLRGGELRPAEYPVLLPLAALTVLGGLWPAILLQLTDPAVQTLLSGAFR